MDYREKTGFSPPFFFMIPPLSEVGPIGKDLTSVCWRLRPALF